MGTNYYLHKKPPCEHCGHADEPLHIGKSSGGWCFSLHVIPENCITTLDNWRDLWNIPGYYIDNEYGDRISSADMFSIIIERSSDNDWSQFPRASDWYKDEADFHRLNHSERGPNGLLRHRIGPHCAGHGEGTWDYILGEFS